MSIGGFEQVNRNLDAWAARQRQRSEDAAGEIAALLEAYCKQTAPFKDRTGNLRNSIRGTWEQAGPNLYRVVLSANTEYAIFVELGHFARRGTTRMSTRAGRITVQRISDRAYGTQVQPLAYLWPSIVANKDRAVHIWAQRLSG